MKNIFIIILLSIGLLSFGQDNIAKTKAKLGVFFGVNKITNGSSPNASSSKTILGFQIGGNINIPMSKHFSFQPEIAFQKFGYSTKSINYYFGGNQTYENTLTLNYLQFPLNFKYSFSKKLDMDLGPSLGFLISSNKLTKGSYNYDDGTVINLQEYEEKNTGRKFLYGINLGLNYNINQNFYVNIRNTFFVGEYFKKENIFRNSILGLNLGYRFK
jgi:hypothetical protein